MGYHIDIKKLIILIIVAIFFVLIVRGCIFSCSDIDKTTQLEPDYELGPIFLTVYNEKEKSLMELSLEEYIIGVVAAEMPASFEMEALKAQAVAARTYTVSHMGEYQGSICGKSGADLCTSSTCCQAWKSFDDLNKNWGSKYAVYLKKLSNAVIETAGIVAVYNGKPIEALYHSTSGGMTENSEHVFSQALPYLKSVISLGEENTTNYEAEKTIKRKTFVKLVNAQWKKAKLSNESLKSQIKITARYKSGRIESMRLGGVIVSGYELRKLLDLNSANFTFKLTNSNIIFTTRGFGHGVGMSQTGANSMAKGGCTYEEILTHYYTGIKLSVIE